MTGFRTLLIGALGLVASILTAKGIVFPADQQAAVATGIMSVVLVVQRIKTVGPISWKSSTVLYMLVGVAFAVLQGLGVVLPADAQAGVMTGAMAVLGLIMRAVTKTPVGGGS